MLSQQAWFNLLIPLDDSTYQDIIPSGYCAISVLYYVYLRLQQGQRKKQARRCLPLTIPRNRILLCDFISLLLTMLSPDTTPALPRIKECFQAITAALRVGVQIFIRPAGGDHLLPDW